MKSNKEKVYDFIRLHADEKADRGISTAYIADAMELQRTNVSSILNLLVQEGRIQNVTADRFSIRLEEKKAHWKNAFLI